MAKQPADTTQFMTALFKAAKTEKWSVETCDDMIKNPDKFLKYLKRVNEY
jgi:hypothetical protein